MKYLCDTSKWPASQDAKQHVQVKTKLAHTKEHSRKNCIFSMFFDETGVLLLDGTTEPVTIQNLDVTDCHCPDKQRSHLYKYCEL